MHLPSKQQIQLPAKCQSYLLSLDSQLSMDDNEDSSRELWIRGPSDANRWSGPV